jgi:protein-S-isoprenylcysteine O-methyltransferase Ste14
MNALELKVPPVALVLIVVALMWVISAYEPSLRFAWPWRAAVAATFVTGGFLISLAGVVAFHRAQTTVNPLKPETASAMVTSGIYRYSRNPMYLGLLFGLTGWAVYLSDPLAFLLLPIFVAYMNRFQIAPEERALAVKFGRQFTDYTRSVRRWL